jgi:peptidoglycan/xylan/chitin deacetylase (PgdA/CDA1 family)
MAHPHTADPAARPPAELPFERELRRPGRRARELVRGLVGRATWPLGTIVRVATREPAVALTFDDGPSPDDTPVVLDLLAEHGARATFFMVGERARAHPELVARVLAGGHAIANHGWDHSSFLHLDGAERRAQIAACQAALGPAAVPLFRPPYGEQNVASLHATRSTGHQVVTWDVVAEDWRDHPAQWLLGRVLRRLRRGSIVLFHDTLYATDEERFRDRTPLHAALRDLLRRLRPGWRCVTVPELLRMGRAVRWPHFHRLPASFHASMRLTAP